MRRSTSVATVAIVVALNAPLAGAQSVESFAQLPLRINAGDDVRAIDQSGARVTGRVVSFGRDGLMLRTDDGDRRFTPATTQRIAVRSSSKARGALIGAGTFLVIGLVGCPEDSAEGCPVFAALLWGAPLGTLIGAWAPSMHTIYRSSASHPSNDAPEVRGPSLLNNLGMRVNLNDKLTVETIAGESSRGTLTMLADDWLELCESGDCRQQGAYARLANTASPSRFSRENIRRVSVTHSSTRKATLIGFLAASVACLPSAGNDWPDAFVLCGGLGAGIGALVGVRMHHTTVVYPAAPADAHVSFAPMMQRERVGLRVGYRF